MLLRALPLTEHRRLERVLALVRICGGVLALVLGTVPLEAPNAPAQILGLALIGYAALLWRLEDAVRTGREQRHVDRIAFTLDICFTAAGLLLTLADPEWVASIVGVSLILVASIRVGRLGALIAMGALLAIYVMGVVFRERVLGLGSPVDQVISRLVLYASVAWLAGVAVETTRRLTDEPYFGPLRPIIDSAHDAFVALDERRRIKEWSARATALFGWSRREVIGRPYDSLVPERHRAILAPLLDDFLASRKRRGSRVIELELRHRAGHEVPVEIAVSRVDALPTATVYAFVRDTSERKELQRERERYLDHDALTGLASARLLHQRLLDTHVAAAGQGAYSLLLLDLDHFREVNAAFGHVAGDALIVAVARRLERAITEPALVARWSGDQFVILLPGSGRFAAEESALRILGLFQDVFVAGGQTVELGVSIGISVHPEHGTEVALLFGRADQALAAAKKLTSTFAFFGAELESRGPSPRLPLRADLRRAIRDDELALLYQPIVRLRGGAIEGFEALARWDHPILGTIPTDEFIDLAERTGLIRGLTEWALERAARDISRWRLEQPDLRVSVNLSARAFSDAAVSQHIEEVSRRLGGNAAGLTIEITESMLLHEPERARDRIDRWRAAGVHVDIDDFGTGYSSLVYMQQLNADAIKIDRQFVSAMAADPRSETIVRASIELGHELGFAVVAEGIEDQRTWDLLVASGCDRGQGYHVSRPMPASAVPEWIASWERHRTPELFAAASPNSRGRVLVVEDDRAILSLISDVLVENGYTVDRATDGREAVGLAARRPDAVILDMHLPVMQGAQVAEALRAGGLEAPFIAMTAGPSAMRFASEIQASASLSKPFDIQELIAVTGRMVGGRSRPTSTAES